MWLVRKICAARSTCIPKTVIANSLDYSEALFEDTSFPARELAALVAAKIYYYLQEYDESMVFALGAGKLFDIDCGGEFEDTIIGVYNLRRRRISCADH